MKKFKDALEIVDNLKSSGTTQLINADGSALLTDKSSISEMLAEHFSSVLSRPSTFNDNATNKLSQIEWYDFPTVAEIMKTIQHLSSGKSHGSDAIPDEIY